MNVSRTQWTASTQCLVTINYDQRSHIMRAKCAYIFYKTDNGHIQNEYVHQINKYWTWKTRGLFKSTEKGSSATILATYDDVTNLLEAHHEINRKCNILIRIDKIKRQIKDHLFFFPLILQISFIIVHAKHRKVKMQIPCRRQSNGRATTERVLEAWWLPTQGALHGFRSLLIAVICQQKEKKSRVSLSSLWAALSFFIFEITASPYNFSLLTIISYFYALSLGNRY